MAKAWIRAVKEMDERPHPNLRKKIYLNVQIIEAGEDRLRKMKPGLIRRIFRREGMKTYPRRYPFESEEEISVVIEMGEDTEEVFEDTVKIPENFRGRNAESVDIYS